jgi:hypothetical protein
MKSRFPTVLVLTATLLAGAVHASYATKQHVTLDRPALLGETVLPAGEYRIDLFSGPDTARFVQGKRTVAEAPYKVTLVRLDHRGDAVHYLADDTGRERLIKIVFASSGLVVEFPIDGIGRAGASIADAVNRP